MNGAETIGMDFKFGAGQNDLEVKNVNLVRDASAAAALRAAIPTEMAVKTIQAWHARGDDIGGVRHEKCADSGWVDPPYKGNAVGLGDDPGCPSEPAEHGNRK